jgi:hypothetical protein
MINEYKIAPWNLKQVWEEYQEECKFKTVFELAKLEVMYKKELLHVYYNVIHNRNLTPFEEVILENAFKMSDSVIEYLERNTNMTKIFSKSVLQQMVLALPLSREFLVL